MDTTPELVTLQPTTTAVVRATVPMSELTAFFDRAFHEVMEAVQAQEASITGPPFAIYYGTPSETVDLAAGFPTTVAIEPTGEVTPSELPGGAAAQLLHVGSYDSLEGAYGRVMAWMGEHRHRPAEVMWEISTSPPPTATPAPTRRSSPGRSPAERPQHHRSATVRRTVMVREVA